MAGHRTGTGERVPPGWWNRLPWHPRHAPRALARLSATLAACLIALAPLPDGAAAADLRYLRIGTGPPGESYFLFGGLFASALSRPPGTPCPAGSACGLPGVIGTASATSGSVANALGIGDGTLDAGLVQADIAAWIAAGAPPFQGRALPRLRAIANLYGNPFHLVAREGSGILSPRDLRGKRVSLGLRGSGTLVHARQVLAAWSLGEADMTVSYAGSAVAADRMLSGDLDAFFVIDGPPVPSVAELARTARIRLVPIDGPGADRLRRADLLLGPASIPAGTYPGQITAVPTLAVGVNLVVSETMPDDLAYGLARVLWAPRTLSSLVQGVPQAAGLAAPAGLIGLGLDLHPGARRYYRDAGLMSRAD
ncbi:MAG: TAXI family TRAP transporter solute-binding subunit [Telmatospirillum sp.]|nr:TAXI family TRAP transporter solute-binding subunit [Telmatospirillum sp.]